MAETQPYVVIRDGVVVNPTSVEVLVLDCLDSDAPWQDVHDEVVDLRERAHALFDKETVAECDRWLEKHADEEKARIAAVKAPAYGEDW